MANVIAVTNQKGGVGKTTTAINLSYYLAKCHNARTLLIDFDPQGNATSGMGIDKQELKSPSNLNGALTVLDVVTGEADISSAIKKTKFKNLSIMPSTVQLADAEVGLSNRNDKFTCLNNAISKVKDDYDFIIIDSPPSLSILTLNVLVASDYVLLPVQAEFYALEGLTQLLETIKLVRQSLNPTIEILGVVVTMMDSRTALSRQVYQEVARYFPGKVLKNSVPRNVRLAEAPSHGLPVGVYDRFSKGAKAYKMIAKEILSRLGW